MKNDIILIREIDVSCWHVEATLALAKERSELMPVLIRARETGGSSSADIASHLLFDVSSRKKVAERLLNIAEIYGLMTRDEQNYSLTEDGNKALDTKRVFVPEDGTWNLWMSDDPLLPYPLISVSEYFEPSATNEILNKKSNENERTFEELPDWVLDLEGDIATPCIGGGEIRFDDFERKAEPVYETEKLNLIWNVSKARLKLKGRLAGKEVNSDLTAPDVDPVDIWNQLLKSKPKPKRYKKRQESDVWYLPQEEVNSLFDDWNTTRKFLKVGFSGTSDIERKTMFSDITFETPDIDGFDSFNNFTASGIKIAPGSDEDAQAWAEWRLTESVSDYASYEHIFAWWEQAKKPFADFEINIPERSKYALLEWYKKTEIPSHRAWFLIAAEDWRL